MEERKGRVEGEDGWGRKGVKPVYLREESDSRLPANNPPLLSAFPRDSRSLFLLSSVFHSVFFSARFARLLLQMYCNSPSSLCFSSPSQTCLKKRQRRIASSIFLAAFEAAAPLRLPLVTPLFRGDISKKRSIVFLGGGEKGKEKNRGGEEACVSSEGACVCVCHPPPRLLFDSVRGPPVSTSRRRSQSRHSSRGGV